MSPVKQVILSLADRCARLAIELEDAQRRLRQEESGRGFAEGVSSERYDAVVQELNALRSANQALAGTNSRFLTEINTLRAQIQQQKGVE